MDFRVSARQATYTPHTVSALILSRNAVAKLCRADPQKSTIYTRRQKNNTEHTPTKTVLSGKWREPCLGSPSIHTQQNWSKMSITAIDRIAPPRSGSILYDHLVSVSKLFGSLKGPPALCAPVPARVLERERASVSCAMLSEAYRAKLQCRWHPPPSSAPLSAPPAAAGPPSPD